LGTKEKLLDSAEKCLLVKGSHAASVKTIAAMAGVNHGLVHHYFGSKEGLFIELLKKHFDTIKPSPCLSMEREEDLICYLTETIILNSRMMIELSALSFRMPDLRKALVSKSIEMRKSLESILQIDKETSVLLLSAVSGLGFHATLDNEIGIEKYIRLIVRSLYENRASLSN